MTPTLGITTLSIILKYIMQSVAVLVNKCHYALCYCDGSHGTEVEAFS